jgi:hypothetical protein
MVSEVLGALTDLGFLAAMTDDQVRDLLKARTNGNQAAWAADNGVSPAVVSDVLNRRRDPSPAILRALGLTKVVTYRSVT